MVGRAKKVKFFGFMFVVNMVKISVLHFFLVRINKVVTPLSYQKIVGYERD